MGKLLKRVSINAAGEPIIGPTSVQVSTLIRDLESAANPLHLSNRHHLDAADILAALIHIALGTEGDPGPTLIQTKPARPKLETALAEPALAHLFPDTPRPVRLSLAAALLQIFDFWHNSHEAAQQADDLGESRFAPYWHAIAHRREPDAGNALYWYRRVGKHPISLEIAEHSRHLGWTGPWEISRFVESCVHAKLGTEDEARLRRIQRSEMKFLLIATISSLNLLGTNEMSHPK